MTSSISPWPASAPEVAAQPAFDIRALYRRVRGASTAGDAVTTVLHLGDEHTLLASGTDAMAPSVVLTLALGRLKTAREFFRGDLPLPLELETAIAQVEDEVYTAHVGHRSWVPQGALVVPYATDPALHDIASLAGVGLGVQRVLTLDAMERLFNRLAAVSEGRPAAHEGLPASVPFAATLLVLRELMHHLLFKTLILLPPTGAARQFKGE